VCCCCYRCNAADLLSSLETLAGILIEHRLSLAALPLLSLWEHVALHATHNTPSLVLARVKRVKALCQLGLLAEAGIVLRGLLQGSTLPGVLLHAPQPILGQDGLGPLQQQQQSEGGGKGAAGNTGVAEAGDAAGAAAVLNAGRWSGHASNAAALAMADAVLPACVADVYGPWLCGQVAVARAAWLAAAGSVPNCWRSGCYPFEAAGSSSSADVKAGGASSHATPAAAAAGKGGAAAAAGESAESKLLDKAAKLLQGVIRTSRITLGLPAIAGCNWDQDSGEAGAAAGNATGAKGTSSSSKGSPTKGSGVKQAKGHGGKGGKGDKHGQGAAAAAAAASAAGAGSVGEGVDHLLQAQQQQLLVEGLMQLAEVS
jgi:hypothetical protein